MLQVKPLDLSLADVQKALPSACYMPENVIYQQSYMHGWKFEDCSFALHDGEAFIAGCCMTTGTGPQGQQALSAYGLPAVWIQSQNIHPEYLNEVQNIAKKKITPLLEGFRAVDVLFEEHLSSQMGLSPVATLLLDAGLAPVNTYSATIPLEWSETTLWAHIRKSYKPFINKGKREFTFRKIDSNTITTDDIEAFRSLHIHVSGRETRSHDSWLRQFDVVKADNGFMIFIYLAEELVGASYFITCPKRCYYGVGAYKRELFDRPLAHAALWQAILEAKERGCKFFDMGRWYTSTEDVSEKERAIGKFKRGFGGIAMVSLVFSQTVGDGVTT